MGIGYWVLGVGCWVFGVESCVLAAHQGPGGVQCRSFSPREPAGQAIGPLINLALSSVMAALGHAMVQRRQVLETARELLWGELPSGPGSDVLHDELTLELLTFATEADGSLAADALSDHDMSCLGHPRAAASRREREASIVVIDDPLLLLDGQLRPRFVEVLVHHVLVKTACPPLASKSEVRGAHGSHHGPKVKDQRPKINDVK